MRSNFLIKLLKGYTKSTEIDAESLEFMDIHFKSDSFIVIMIQINSDSSFFESNNEKERALARFVVGNVGSELIEEDELIQYIVEIETDIIACVINPHTNLSASLLQKKVSNYIDNLLKALELCELNVIAGVSDTHNNIVELKECYDEAMKVLNYSQLKGTNKITFFNELAVKQDYYYYPIEMEVKLTNILNSGDYSNAEELIHNLFDINFRSRDTSLAAGRYFLIDIITTFVKIMSAISAKEESFDITFSIDHVIGLIDSAYNIAIIEDGICKLALEICNAVQDKCSSPSARLIDEVEEFIQKHYYEGWLSLTVIANEFNVTPQYLSNLFKKYRNENISDYISKLKVEKCKNLLLDSDLTIKEISFKLGYANEAGISRTFKKYEGITPGVYRNQVRI